MSLAAETDSAPPARFDLSEATARALELPALLALVAQRTATDLGRTRIEALEPAASEAELRARRALYEEAERLVAAHRLVPSAELPFAPLLAAIGGVGQDLASRDLARVGDLLAASEEARERILAADPPCPALAARVALVRPLADVRALLERTFDRRGEIRENATPRLAQLRGRIRVARDRAYKALSGLVEAHREVLSEDTVPMRAGRLVLVLQAGAKGRVPGLLHGRSGSGKSFYFEPLEAVEVNNELQGSFEEEEEEKRRIVAEVVRRLRAAMPDLLAHGRLVGELDAHQAAVRFAQEGAGRLAELGPRHQLRFLGARHPLLDPTLASLRGEALGTPGHTGTVVPLDLELDAERRLLVVTGPNAGGKTVALKTVGLLTLAHQLGLPVLADVGTRLPALTGLVATVGDEQDLLADRSTFSGRLLRLKEAWELASPTALVLLDELGSGTDPEEGAALSVALIEGLAERGALGIVTTHLSPVAAAAMETGGAACASMQFDPATGAPTYRLMPGPPGGSEAMALARRLGLPAAWLDRAEALLGAEHRDLRRLLAELERTRGELATTEGRLRIELADAETLRSRLAQREAELVQERKTVGKALAAELEAFRRKTLDGLRAEVTKIEARHEEGRRRGLAAEAVERLFAEAPVLAPVEETAAAVAVGGTVRHRRLGWTGVLEVLDRGKAQVRVGGKLLRCATEDLAGVAGPAPGPKRLEPPVTAPDPGDDRPRELMLIGQRVEPALESLDRFLDRALLAAAKEVRVVHGHGSGRLREAIRGHLRRHPAVAVQRPGGEGEGGNGATVVVLAGSP